MKNFNFNDRQRGRNDSSRRSFGNRDSRELSFHDAVCDQCGKDCQVPFKPSGDKPIYCSDCFERKGGRDGGRDSGRSGQRDSQRRNFNDRPSRPPQANTGDQSTQKLVEKIVILNTKLDTIISLLSTAGQKKSDSVIVEVKKSKKAADLMVDKLKEKTKSKPKKIAKKK